MFNIYILEEKKPDSYLNETLSTLSRRTYHSLRTWHFCLFLGERYKRKSHTSFIWQVWRKKYFNCMQWDVRLALKEAPKSISKISYYITYLWYMTEFKNDICHLYGIGLRYWQDSTMRFVICMYSGCEISFKGMPQKHINRKLKGNPRILLHDGIERWDL